MYLLTFHFLVVFFPLWCSHYLLWQHRSLTFTWHRKYFPFFPFFFFLKHITWQRFDLTFSATVNKEGRDEAFFLKGVQNLAKLYDFDGSETCDFLGFQHILDQLDEDFDVAAKLKEVSDNMLLWIRCTLRHHSVYLYI